MTLDRAPLSMFTLAALVGACVPEAGVAPCTSDLRCLVGYECVDDYCLECVEGTCGGLVKKNIGPEGGRFCGPDEACVEILPGTFTSSVTLGIRRSRREAPPLDVRSVLYEVLPREARLAIPARISVPISPSARLGDVRVFFADGPTAGFAPLPGMATEAYANGTTDKLGTFVAVRVAPSN